MPEPFQYPPKHDQCRCQVVQGQLVSLKVKFGDGAWFDLAGNLLLDNPLFDELRAIVEADDARGNDGSF